MDKVETSLLFTGTQINYYYICHRKLWLFSHGLNMEQTSDAVYLGKMIGEESYDREKKEIQIDNLITIDFIGKESYKQKDKDVRLENRV
jgi:CRISPR-associated exonuclease Cas4